MADRRITHRMARLLHVWLACLCLTMPTLATAGCDENADASQSIAVRIEGRDFLLEPAFTPAKRFQGLSDRKHIADDGGMLFGFTDARVRQFVMRRCLVPIDIIFLTPTGRVIVTHAMQVEPYDTPESQLKRYSSEWSAQFAIELQGGMVEKLGIQPGDRIDLDWQAMTKRVEQAQRKASEDEEG